MTNYTHESYVFFEQFLKQCFFLVVNTSALAVHFINLVLEDWSRERMREQEDRCTPSKKDERRMLTLQLVLKKDEKEDD